MNQEPKVVLSAEIVPYGHPKVLFSTATRDISAVLQEVLRLQLHAVELKGYERSLFKKYFSFSDAAKQFTENPVLTSVHFERYH